MKDFSEFESRVGITFKNKEILKQAFIHRSYINEKAGSGLRHNERLEFLGDAVLELVSTNMLYFKYPDNPEGDLTAFRAALVNTQSIGGVAEDLKMNDYLLLSKGEAKDAGKARVHILANTFEAVIGAIYLDQGYDVAAKFIEDNLLYKIDEIVEKSLWRDSKSYIQEKAQEIVGFTPEYKILEEKGPDHDKHFTSGIFFGDELIVKGKGKSKQEAEQDAARRALEEKKWTD